MTVLEEKAFCVTFVSCDVKLLKENVDVNVKMDIQIRILWILHWQSKSVFCVQSAGFIKVCLFLSFV